MVEEEDDADADLVDFSVLHDTFSRARVEPPAQAAALKAIAPAAKPNDTCSFMDPS
jgi:hypothetical protein